MNRVFRPAAFIAGLAVLGWVGAGYVGTHPLALGITVLVGAFYLMGALELHRFRQATAALAQAVADLAEPPSDLRAWIERLHPSLRNAVRRRVEGEPVGLPGPAMAPYLAGLLVLLGMLGTFLGMVLTLRGTGLALESATDLPAVRDALVAPVRGLGLAFGTSVAGVAASAALGLLSALCRRERAQAAQALDARIATTLRVHSTVHHAARQREESLKLLQRQAELVPALVDRLQAMMDAMAHQAAASDARLLATQEHFHGQAEAAYAGLAAAVGRTLQDSLTEGARIAGATIRPVVEATMAGIARETATLHETLAETVQRQMGLFGERLGTTTADVAQAWQSALARHEQVGEQAATHARQALAAATAGFEQQAAALLRTAAQSHADMRTDLAAHEQRRAAALTQSLEAMAGTLRQEWRQAGEHAIAQQQRLHETMERTAREINERAEAHARDTAAGIAGLLQAASEAPRAAADAIAELRRKLSESVASDNALLEERARILDTLNTLLDTVNQAATEQRGAIDALVGSSAALLDRVGARFAERVDAEAGKLAAVAAQVTGGAVEVASLGEAFGFAVELFSHSNDKLVSQLERIDGALNASMARSDEQLAYYVAQAREVIDLSILSQKQIIESLQRLPGRAAPAEAAAR